MSEVFEEYLRIMREKQAEAKSEDAKDIAKLYNVKPDSIYDYNQNIMESAHPEKCIIAPAYDRINALLENEIERQRITLNIVNKPSNGYLTNHRYAQEDLMMTLTKVANDLDNQDQEDLRKLADVCLTQLHSQALSWTDVENWFGGTGDDLLDVGEGAAIGGVSGAIIGGLIGAFGGPVGIAAGAALGAAGGATIAALFKTGPQAKNVAINAQIAQAKLAEIGHTDALINNLIGALAHVAHTADQYAELVSQARLQDSDASKGEAQKLGLEYQNEIIKIDGMIKAFLSNAKSGFYEPKDSGEIWDKIKAPWKALVGDKLSDAVKALEVLHRVGQTAIQGIIEFRAEASQLKEQVPTEVKAPTPVKLPAEKKSPKDLVHQFKQVINQFDEK